MINGNETIRGSSFYQRSVPVWCRSEMAATLLIQVDVEEDGPAYEVDVFGEDVLSMIWRDSEVSSPQRYFVARSTWTLRIGMDITKTTTHLPRAGSGGTQLTRYSAASLVVSHWPSKLLTRRLSSEKPIISDI